MSPALQGGFFTTGPPGKSPDSFIFLRYFITIFFFLALHGLSLAAASGGYSLLWCAGFSLWWLLLLQSMGSRCTGLVVVVHGLSSCGTWALEHRLSSCGAQA